MSRVRLGPGNLPAAPVVPFPNQHRVPRKGLRRREIFGPILSPETLRAAEGRDSTLDGDPGAGKDGYVYRLVETLICSLKVFIVSGSQSGHLEVPKLRS